MFPNVINFLASLENSQTLQFLYDSTKQLKSSQNEVKLIMAPT
jgi:nitrate/nitrite-specific signal transduction histidine kinase